LKVLWIIALLVVFTAAFCEKPAEILANEAEVAGDTAFNAKSYADAAAQYEIALTHMHEAAAAGTAQTEEIPRVEEKLFKAYYFGGQYEKSVEAYKRYLALKPGDVKAVRTIAQILAKKLKDVERAITELEAFDANTANFQIRKDIAGYYEDLGNTDKELEWYIKANELKSDADVIQRIASLYVKKGDNANAVKAYEDYLATNPPETQVAQTYKNLGVLYDGMKNAPKAIEWFEKALGMQYDGDIATKLMVMYYDRADYEKSMSKVSLILTNAPEDESAIFYRALIKVKQGDKPGAIEDFKKLENSSRYGADARNNIKALQG